MNTYNTERDPVEMHDGPHGWEKAAPSSDGKTWAVAAHLATFVISGPIGPLVVWLLGRHREEFVDYHGKEAVNFQITMLIAAFALVVIGVVTFGVGFLLAIPLVLWNIILTIVAAVNAGNGVWYRYPATIRLV